MKTGDFDIDKFDAYILGQMPAAEADQFAQELKKNPAMAQQFDIYKEMISTVERQGRSEIKNELKNIHREKNREISAQKPIIRKITPWLAAASLLLLIMATWFLTRPTPLPTLANEYFQPYEISVNVRNAQGQESLTEINQLYVNKNYQEAIPLLTEQLKNTPEDNNLRLALAMSYWETNNLSGTKQELEAIRSNGDDFLMDHVNWYSALVALKNNQKQVALEYLKKLTLDPSADHHAEALRLLKTLE